MSSQLQQQQQPTPTTTQQPLLMNPYNVPGQPPPVSRTHSDGSFGGVFIVLAVIVLVSAVACCLGRFCGRQKPKGAGKKHAVAAAARPRKESDIEFGFDHKKIRTANRPVRYGEYKGNNNSKPGLDGGFVFDFEKGSKMMPPNDYDGEPPVGP
ncbi:uncharacterized protein LOC115726130 [Rhodamnia argentea]|uniref:Uncharacterized protein LOC115726130 n=1 Tax=Rhodamnia argentea TaxID=178133 RepID=A0A8B8MPW0_9MYRT|nr:uncharacterized protein LOC115726130 [Rhodamnia argentea]